MAAASTSTIDAAAALTLLEAAPKRGYAAVAILKCSDDGRFVWQRKTPGYPVISQVGGLCFFGGNKESDDATARTTLARELSEELGPDVVATLTPFARFVVGADADLMSPKDAYCFTCCVFQATLPTAPAHTEEGAIEVLTLEQLQGERFCWGYDVVFNAWTTEIDRSGAAGAGTSNTLPWLRCDVHRIAPGANVGEWAGGEEAWR